MSRNPCEYAGENHQYYTTDLMLYSSLFCSYTWRIQLAGSAHELVGISKAGAFTINKTYLTSTVANMPKTNQLILIKFSTHTHPSSTILRLAREKKNNQWTKWTAGLCSFLKLGKIPTHKKEP